MKRRGLDFWIRVCCLLAIVGLVLVLIGRAYDHRSLFVFGITLEAPLFLLGPTVLVIHLLVSFLARREGNG